MTRRGHLVRKEIRDKNGMITTRWVRPEPERSTVLTNIEPEPPRGTVKEMKALRGKILKRLMSASNVKKTGKYQHNNISAVQDAFDAKDVGLLRLMDRHMPKYPAIWVKNAYDVLVLSEIDYPEDVIGVDDLEASRRLGESILVTVDKSPAVAALDRKEQVGLYFYALQLACLNENVVDHLLYLINDRGVTDRKLLTDLLRESISVPKTLLDGAI